jgi:hypothetical protein
MQVSEAVEKIKQRYPVERWGLFPAKPCGISSKPRKVDKSSAKALRDAENTMLRAEAEEAGLMCYTRRVACKCGNAEFYVANNKCVECQKRMRKALRGRA